MHLNSYSIILFDWGDTVMKDDPTQIGSMADWERVEAIAGVEALLEFLRRSGKTIALATGAAVSNETQIRAALARLNLDQFFDKIYCYSSTGQRKPSAGFYRFILDDLKARPAQTLMIGDSFENDVLAANQVGIAGVWFNPSMPEKRDEAGFVSVCSMAELLARFQQAG